MGSLSWMTAKIIYKKHENMQPMQMMVIRSFFNTLILIIVLNFRLKFVIYDSGQSDLRLSLGSKILQYNLLEIFSMILLKHVPLTIIAMANNCSPFLVMVLALLILKEKASCVSVSATLIAIVGASIVVFGANDDTKKQNISLAIIYLLLTLNPILKASGTILLRILKKLDSSTVIT